MISQDDITTLNIYVNYKVSKTIKINNWYCKHIFVVIVLMVEFMQIRSGQRFIRGKGFMDFGLF